MNRFLASGLGVAAIAMACALDASGAAAQTPMVQQPTPNADQLAAQMRILASDPQNLNALLAAGELSVKLADPAAALQFFSRAERVDPRNPRIAAGRAGALVQLGRPGEALRLFAQAEAAGLLPTKYAANRALAYDLIGRQDYAQRDYRTALAISPSDPELIRRYALSLGISGDQEQAFKLLDPLLRKQDRAAWRVRAFILAMAGKTGEAEKIARTVLPGFASAFVPFFERLQGLPPADRAFAVHFGELTRTPARIADASLAPQLPPLGRDSPVALASVEQPAVPVQRAAVESGSPRRNGRSDAGRNARAEKTRQTAPVVLASRQMTGVPGTSARPAMPASTPARAAVAAAQPPARPAGPSPEAVAATAAQPPAGSPAGAAVRNMANAAVETAARPASPPPVSGAVAASVPNSGAAELAAAEQQGPLRPAPAVAAATGGASMPAREPVPVPNSAGMPAPASAAAPAPASAASSAAVAAALPATAPAPGRRIGSEDSVLASIVRGITIPGSELGVEEPAPRAMAAAPAPPAGGIPAESVPVAETTAAAPASSPKPAGTAAKPAAKAEKAEVAKAEPKNPARKPEPRKPDPAKAEPERHWVQVAGGANKADLPKAWKALVAKAPAAFKGKAAWTTPLRATNRLLTGPFQTPEAAQDFVNLIAKQGLPAFSWTSEPGQKIEKLAIK